MNRLSGFSLKDENIFINRYDIFQTVNYIALLCMVCFNNFAVSGFQDSRYSEKREREKDLKAAMKIFLTDSC